MVFSWKEQNRNKKRGVVKTALASMLPTFGSWATTSVTGEAKPGLSGTRNPPKEQDALSACVDCLMISNKRRIDGCVGRVQTKVSQFRNCAA